MTMPRDLEGFDPQLLLLIAAAAARGPEDKPVLVDGLTKGQVINLTVRLRVVLKKLRTARVLPGPLAPLAGTGALSDLVVMEDRAAGEVRILVRKETALGARLAAAVEGLDLSRLANLAKGLPDTPRPAAFAVLPAGTDGRGQDAAYLEALGLDGMPALADGEKDIKLPPES